MKNKKGMDDFLSISIWIVVIILFFLMMLAFLFFVPALRMKKSYEELQVLGNLKSPIVWLLIIVLALVVFLMFKVFRRKKVNKKKIKPPKSKNP